MEELSSPVLCDFANLDLAPGSTDMGNNFPFPLSIYIILLQNPLQHPPPLPPSN